MANDNKTIDINSYLNSLKIPDAIKELPNFNGNQRLLFDFLNNVEEILSIIKNIQDTPLYKLWLRAIRNKIVGQANEVLDTNGTTLNWEEIKDNLISHYSDKRNETSLIRDLHSLKQNNSSIEQFYSSIIEIFSNLNNQINIHEFNDGVKLAKINLYGKMCLNVFLTGLREPIGSVVLARNPLILQNAFEFCIAEQNIHYSRNTIQIKPSTINRPSNENINKFTPIRNIVPQFIRQSPNLIKPFNRNNFPNTQYNNNSYNNPTFNKFPQHTFQNKFPYQSNFNRFGNPNYQQKISKPEPMDIDSSRYAKQNFNKPMHRPNVPNNYFSPRVNNPNIRIEELHNKEHTKESYNTEIPESNKTFNQLDE